MIAGKGRDPLRLLPTILAVALSMTLSAPVRAADGMPAGYGAYHTYAEMVQALDRAEAAYPHLVRKFSIGRSYEGRTIWAVKVSADVAHDRAKPEVVMESLSHGRERLTVEQNLYVLRLLTEGYGHSQRITRILDRVAVYLIPMLNPDGGEYDVTPSGFRSWRKNRQPIPGHAAVGVDINRNFGFKWGCCSRSKPGWETYRGPSPWYAPEARAYRDFIRSRVVDGRQRVTIAISWHSSGEEVLYPYGYTSGTPATMTADDRRTFVALANGVAARNGYEAKRSGSSYAVDGTGTDWAHHEQRIFQLTVELYPGSVNFYPAAHHIGPQTERNREAILYLLEHADCPYRAAGLADTHCGPLNDDFEIDRGWQLDRWGTDDAISGAWQRAIPHKTAIRAGVIQRRGVTSGQASLVTGAKRGRRTSSNDVDGGTTSVVSAPIALGHGRWQLSLRYSFAHNARASAADSLRVSIVSGGTRTPVLEEHGRSAHRSARWLAATISLDAWAGQTIRVLIEATDGDRDSLVEAQIDDLRVYARP